MNGETALRITLRPLGTGGAALAIGVALATLVIVAYSLRSLPPARRMILVALRALALLCALALVFQPALRRERRATHPSRVAVLLDESASMALPLAGAHAPDRLSRARTLAEAAASYADPASGRTVELYALGTGRDDAPIAVPPAALAAQHATGGRTALLEALTSLPRGVERDLSGVIVLSDGADHGRVGAAKDGKLDDATLDALRALGAPVHTVALGEADVRDLVVGRVARDDFAFVRTPISFDVPIEALSADRAGWVGRTVPVLLRRDGVVVASEQLVLKNGMQHVKLRHVPERTGEFVFDVSVPAQAGELTAANNVARFSLRVVRDRVRVLQVCGRPSWDERFLRSLFKRDPNVDLVSFFILRTPNSIQIATTDELSLIPFPTDELFRESLNTFDLVVLQNFDYGPYEMGMYLPLIRRYVEGGGALAMLGGELSFSGGGYAGTALETILPVELDGGSDAAHGSPSRAATFDPQPMSPRLTPIGRSHPLTALALDVEESARLFAALPALDGVNLVRRARADATVLAVHPTLLDADRKPLPVIAVREAGKGRVLTVGSDSTWRWSFEGDARGARRPYERFWESAVRWLVRDPSLSLLRLELDRASLENRGVLPIVARAVGPDYRPIGGAKLSFALERIPDLEGPGPVSVGANLVVPPAEGATGESGTLERTITALPEGGYRLRAHATLGGRDADAEEVFLVHGAATELADPAAHPAVLGAIAAATGGEAREGSRGVSGLRMLPPREIRIAASEDRALWTSPLLLFIAVGALALAWALGRRWGRR